MLNEAEKCFKIKGAKVARGSPTINYLFFLAYNSIVFYRANTTEWREIQNLLDMYEAVSGQEINKHKTEIYFSSNTCRAMRNQILDLAMVSLCCSQERYIELPIMVGINRYRIFEAIKDKVWARVSN